MASDVSIIGAFDPGSGYIQALQGSTGGIRLDDVFGAGMQCDGEGGFGLGCWGLVCPTATKSQRQGERKFEDPLMHAHSS